MKIDITKHVPPGQDIKEERAVFGIGITLAAIFSMGYLLRYVDEWKRLYEWEDGRRVALRNIKAQSFSELLGPALMGFLVLAAFMLCFTVYHYMYYYKDSRSIYLMKRLPDGFERYRRCLTVPVTLALISIAVAIALFVIYFVIYMIFTPGECRVPGLW